MWFFLTNIFILGYKYFVDAMIIRPIESIERFEQSVFVRLSAFFYHYD